MCPRLARRSAGDIVAGMPAGPAPESSARSSRRVSRRRWLRRIAGAAVLSATYGFGVEPRFLRTRRLRFGPPTAGEPVRFAYFTDVHFKGDAALLEAIVARINRRKSELAFAVFGGDIVEEAVHLPAALAVLERLEVPLFGVPGNHDYWAELDFDRVHRSLRKGGGAWLLDEAATVAGGRVRLAGYSCTHAAALAPESGVRNVALVHYPVWADRLPPGWDAILAGHSHGGQVRVPFLGALIKPMDVGAYELGRFQSPAGPLYVSSGVGTFFLNVRFLCPPELVWVEVG